jgi:hypothetical protein
MTKLTACARQTLWILGGLIAGAGLAPRQATGQTFSQILQLGEGVGPRLTRTVTLDSLNSSLFAVVYDHVTWVDARGSNPIVYEFAADPIWSKVVFSRKDDWIRGFNDWSAPDPVVGPRSLDVSGSRKLFITDPPTGRVLVVTLDEAQKRLTRVGSLSAGLTFPLAVAWDGATSPLSGEAVYLVDAEAPLISYWTKSGSTWTRSWSYGQVGSGTGQFSGPTGICVGHSASSLSSSSVFTNNFYVADAGNRRIVWLQRNGTSVTWKLSRSLPEGWRPTDCTVDHFGNVYVVDRENSQLVKYTWSLAELDRYGSYGTGTINYDTFANPHAVHVPFGIKTVGGQDVWYGEGRILTAEDWGPNSGGLEHYLGVDIPWATAGGGFSPRTDFHMTDHADITVEVLNSKGLLTQTIFLDSFFPPGVHSAVWDGTTSSGSIAPEGQYRFRVTAESQYCSGPAYCQKTVLTNLFTWLGPCEDPWDPACNPPELNVAIALADLPLIAHIPSSFRLGQAITPYTGPLFRVEGLGAAGGAGAAMSGAQAVASVRAHGIRALRVDVPPAPAPADVTIRIYSLTGRLVRILVDEALERGTYLVGWDGEDAGGARVAPGVNLALRTAGSFRGMQRLIIK